MAKYNVKKIENTNAMTTTLSTVCKKQTTAENRFTRFLETYDSCFTETMLKCFMNIKPVGYVNGELISQATIEENEYTMCVQISDNTYIIYIEFKHDDNTSNTNETTDSTTESDTKDTESDTKDTESDTKDTESSNNTTESNANNETSVNHNAFAKYINNINNVLKSIGNKQLIQKYVDGINNGLQNDNYNIARQCFCKLVQILPDGYEICFTTEYNVDIAKVDEAIYNHRYKITRDKTGIMFTIHKYSEVQHKYIQLKPETEIANIIRYIYFKTFDSVCFVFEHLQR
jgi:hypothetical protein